MSRENVGVADRFVRLLIGLVLFGLAIAGFSGGSVIWALYALSAVLLVTAAVGYCPLYSLIGVDTRLARTRSHG